jgi:hypothetical protein
VGSASSNGDVTTTSQLPTPFTGYLQKIVHQDGSVEFQAYRDADLRHPAPFHSRLDPPQYEERGNAYPVTRKWHTTIADTHSDVTLVIQDPDGSHVKMNTTYVEEDGVVTKSHISVINGIANGTVTTEDSRGNVLDRGEIKDIPMMDLGSYLPFGGLSMSTIAPRSTSSISFDPSTLSQKERQAWLRNQATVAKETQKNSGPESSLTTWQIQGLGILRLGTPDSRTKHVGGSLQVETDQLEGIHSHTVLNMSGSLVNTSLLLKGYQTSGSGDYIHMDKEVPSYQFMLSIEAQFDQVSAPTHLDGNGTLTKSVLFRGDKGKVVRSFGIIGKPIRPGSLPLQNRQQDANTSPTSDGCSVDLKIIRVAVLQGLNFPKSVNNPAGGKSTPFGKCTRTSPCAAGTSNLPCDQHDFCYGTCRPSTYKSDETYKWFCDASFSQAMHDVCLQAGLKGDDDKTEALCERWADVYASFLEDETLGMPGSFYRSAQLKACQSQSSQ